MSPKTRKILYILFLLLFLTITPIVTLLAFGYSINISWPPKFNQTLQKTGMLIIDSKPTNAKIFINNKPQLPLLSKYFTNQQNQITTPAKIKNLVPGEYNLRLEMDGYWPWEKKLTVNPGQSTFAENISLFRKDTPLAIYQGDYLNYKFSHNSENIAVIEKTKLTIVKANEGENVVINQINTSNNLAWSINDEYLLAGKVIFSTDSWSLKSNIEQVIGKDAQNNKWDIENDNVLYYTRDHSINQLNIDNLTSKTIYTSKTASTTDKIIDYFVKNNKLYLIENINRDVSLNIISLSDESKQKISLPASKDYEFVNLDNYYLNIINKNKKILYLIDGNNLVTPLKSSINNIKISQWIKNDRLLYANDYELWLSDIANSRLLTRISHEIKNISWHPNNNYAIYSTDKTIDIIELDEREKHNITELVSASKIDSIYLNPKGNILYFNGSVDEKPGIYKIVIQ